MAISVVQRIILKELMEFPNEGIPENQFLDLLYRRNIHCPHAELKALEQKLMVWLDKSAGAYKALGPAYEELEGI